MFNLIWLIPVFPLLAFALIILVTHDDRKNRSAGPAVEDDAFDTVREGQCQDVASHGVLLCAQVGG